MTSLCFDDGPRVFGLTIGLGDPAGIFSVDQLKLIVFAMKILKGHIVSIKLISVEIMSLNEGRHQADI